MNSVGKDVLPRSFIFIQRKVPSVPLFHFPVVMVIDVSYLGSLCRRVFQ